MVIANPACIQIWSDFAFDDPAWIWIQTDPRSVDFVWIWMQLGLSILDNSPVPP